MDFTLKKEWSESSKNWALTNFLKIGEGPPDPQNFGEHTEIEQDF